jgi:maltokinase
MTAEDSVGEVADAIVAFGAELLRSSVPTAAPPTPNGALALEASLDLGAGRLVCVVADESAQRWTVPMVRERGRFRRARAGDGVAAALVDRVGGPPLSPPFALTSYPVGHRADRADQAGERAMGVDQTNESVVVGEAAVVKWCLRLPERGAAGEAAAVRRLTALAAAGFQGMPRVWGLLTVDLGEPAPLLLANLTGYVPGAVDGWEWATADARRFASRSSDLAEAVVPAVTLGGLTAQMHLAFASSGRAVATADDASGWAAAAQRDLAAAMLDIDGAEGARLAARAPKIGAGLAVLAGIAGTPLIDVHGDLHVGQVLRHSSPPLYAITDFDGNPVATADEHTDRQPAAVDVAGMAASLDHVGRVVLRRSPEADPALVAAWIDAAQEAFMTTYRATLDDGGGGDLLDERLLRPLRLWQECREFLYAARHLPHWRYVPDQALAALMGEPT